MRTIGSFLKSGRKSKSFTFDDLSHETRIKKSFLMAVESQQWGKLPEYTVVVGFVKNIAGALELNRDEAVALLRRDYPPKKLIVNPKPDIPREFRWSPRLTFISGIAIVVLIVMGYLGVQYLRFVQPPMLTVNSPVEGEVVLKSTLTVNGLTDPEAAVDVNMQPAFVDQNGSFSTDLDIDQNVNEVVVTAVSRSGKVATVSRKIKVELSN